MPNTVQVTPSPEMIRQLGGYVQNAVQAANKMVGTLNDASVQLAEASKNISKNSAAIAATATGVVQKNARALAPVIGSTNAAMLTSLPSPVVKSYVNSAIQGGAKTVKNLSVTAKNTAKALEKGLKELNKGAAWLEKNVSKAPLAAVNSAINVNATQALNAGANSLNSAVNAKLPNLNLKANLSAAHTNAVKSIAKNVKNMTASTKTRKNKRN